MNRLVLGVVLLTAALATACGGKNGAGSGSGSDGSLCVAQVPPPVACNTACDPVSGAATCPDGYHCSADGKCDLQCTATGGECGDGNSCTNDGFCQQGSDQGPPAIDANCPMVHFSPTKVTPSILLLIDKSGSMAHDFNDQTTSDPTKDKFTAEQSALVGTTGVVTTLQTSVYFGAMMFPKSGSDCTDVVTAPRALGNAGAINTLMNDNGPSGSTPTADAIKAATKAFANTPPPAGSPPIIVFASDGEPNDCSNEGNSEDNSVAAVQAAYTAGIKTYVLGVGNKFPADFAQKLANAGLNVQTGQPNATAYSANTSDQLAAAFQAIIGGVVSCDLTLNGMVPMEDAAGGNVTLNGTALVFGTDWSLDPNGMIIHLLGNACTTLKSTPNPTVDASFACGAVLF